jgi:aryl-alcohol dehydrogenase-like predicted oxidoreductase
MSKENSFKLLDAFYEAGGNFIDTAVSQPSLLPTTAQRL